MAVRGTAATAGPDGAAGNDVGAGVGGAGAICWYRISRGRAPGWGLISPAGIAIGVDDAAATGTTWRAGDAIAPRPRAKTMPPPAVRRRVEATVRFTV